MSEEINVEEQELILELPDANGELWPAQIRWIRKLEDGFFLANLRYLDNYPYSSDMYVEWLIKTEDGELQPVCNTSYIPWDMNYYKECMERKRKRMEVNGGNQQNVGMSPNDEH